MSIDLLHTWPLFLGSLGIVVASLLLALWLATMASVGRPWLLAGAASLLSIAASMALQPGASLLWHVLSSTLLVGVPVAVGSRRAVRLQAGGASGFAALGGGLVTGLSIGWLLLPIVLIAVSLGILAITR
jgi:hypothetical protein